MKKNNKIKSVLRIILWTCLYLSFYFVGFITGMIFQQELITRYVYELFSYSNIEVNVNINQTKLLEDINKTLVDFNNLIGNRTT